MPRALPDWLKVALAGALMLVVFIGRPVFVDDHAHILEAQGLAREGSGLYQSNSYGMGWTHDSAPGEANPPGYFYAMASWIRLVGPELWKAHFFVMAISLSGLIGFYFLARRFVAYPVWTSLLWMSSLHYWLTSNSLLLDALLGPTFVLSLVLWMYAWESKHIRNLAVASSLLILPGFIKYTGLLALPLAGLWSYQKKPKGTRLRFVWLVVPVALFYGWHALSTHTYGQSHFLAVAKQKLTWPSYSHAFVLAAFATATTPAMLLAGLAWATSGALWKKLVSAAVFSLSMLVGCSLGVGDLNGVLMGVWWGGFILWLVAISLLWQKSKSDTKFLIFWSALTLGGLLVAIPWVCARYFVIAGPALILLTASAVSHYRPDWWHSARWRNSVIALFILVGVLVGHADYAHALADRSAATWANTWRLQKTPEKPGYFAAAHLGSVGYYLEELGWKPLGPGEELPAGGVLCVSTRSLPRRFRPLVKEAAVLAEWSPRSWNPIRTLDGPTGAAFYGSIWGPLPISLSTEPLDHYLIVASAVHTRNKSH